MKKPSICLNMIVKDETHVITRCLDSVRDIIDYWVIADTGSTDGTQALISDYFHKHGIKGELHEHPWKNFGHNRSLASKAAHKKADYILFMDADDILIRENNAEFTALSDSHMLPYNRGSFVYLNKNLVSGDYLWQWQGVLHEFVYCTEKQDEPKNLDIGWIMQSTTEGSRSKVIDKYRRDAKILEEALVEEPDNTRYQFYLAQSYRDAGELVKSLAAYQKRVEMAGWEEEVYCALIEMARLKSLLDYTAIEVLESYLQAYRYRPHRLEGIYGAIQYCREHHYYALGYQLANNHLQKTLTLPNDDLLFVNKEVYIWQLHDEISICASQIGKHQEAKVLLENLLEIESIPDWQRERLNSNLTISLSALK